MAFDILVALIAIIIGTVEGSFIGFIAFWALVNFIFKEYEMDFKSQVMLSLQTFCAATIVHVLLMAFTGNFILSAASFLIIALIAGDVLLIKSGLDKEEALKTAAYWVLLWLVIAVILTVIIGLSAPSG